MFDCSNFCEAVGELDVGIGSSIAAGDAGVLLLAVVVEVSFSIPWARSKGLDRPVSRATFTCQSFLRFSYRGLSCYGYNYHKSSVVSLFPVVVARRQYLSALERPHGSSCFSLYIHLCWCCSHSLTISARPVDNLGPASKHRFLLTEIRSLTLYSVNRRR